jgi:hypothetical protein
MKLPLKMNPAHAASKDHTRYTLNGVQVKGDIAAATDGRMLFMCIGTREEEDDSREAIIPTRAALAGWKQLKRGAALPTLTINPRDTHGRNTCTVMDKDFDRTTIMEIDGNYPRIEAVIPDVTKYTVRVGFNVALLARLAKCFGEDQVTMHLNPEAFGEEGHQEPILVTNGANQPALAVLMPTRDKSEAVKDNAVLSHMTAIRLNREAAARAERERREAEAKAIVEAERAEEAARIEANREKTADWMSANNHPAKP